MTTSVRRLISLFSRSNGLVLHSFFQGASGKSAKAVRSALASVSIAVTAGNLPSSKAATVSSWSRTAGPVGWAKMVRTAAATISASPVRTLASTLRRKCTRHLCQLAPCSTAVTAAASPRWASLMTRCTPVSPARAASGRTRPRTPRSRCRRRRGRAPRGAVGGHAGRDDHGLRDDPAVEAHLAVGGVGEQVGEGGLERPLRERGHLGVERGTNPADLALAHPGEPAHRRDHVVDLRVLTPWT